VLLLAGLPTETKLFGRNHPSRKKSHTLKLFCIDKKMESRWANHIESDFPDTGQGIISGGSFLPYESDPPSDISNATSNDSR
jgi:hypothetical protein